METKETSKQIQDVEVWKEVTLEDFKHYLVSNKGRVWNSRYNRELTPYPSHDGYPTVQLHNTIKNVRTVRVHRLVALAFIPNPENKETVNHKDAVKTNNHVNNLEWMTDEENRQHAYDNGLMHRGLIERNKWIEEKHLGDIKEYLKQGYSVYRIADILGCHYNPIKTLQESHNLIKGEPVVKPYYSLMKLSEEQIEEAYGLFKQGMRFKELSEKYDCQKNTMARTLRRIYGKEHIDYILKQNKKNEELEKASDYLSLLKEGLSINEIAEEVGVYNSTVRSSLYKYYGKEKVMNILKTT